MEGNLDRILEFIQNRHKKGESTGPRHVHIRFDIEMARAEKILDAFSQEDKISKYYDKDYQEERYLPK